MVKKVDVLGKQAERVYVEFSHERLAALGIIPQDIIDSVARQNALVASGSVDTAGDRVHLRVTGQFTSEDDIRNVPIEAGGRLIRLGDFATIERGYQDPPTYAVRQNGHQVLMLGVSMTDEGNIVKLGAAMTEAVSELQSELPYGVDLERVADQPTTVKDAIGEFEHSLLEALVIVLVVSLLSLGWRAGIVVAMSVPLVLGAVAVVMLMAGWNLERVSLGSLIIALGLLVDDSIISLEMMMVKLEGGWERAKAAAFSYSATAVPRLTGALITVAAFMPIGFSKSSSGEYAGGIFWIVGAAVLISWIVSGVFTPYLAVKFLPKDLGKHHAGGDPYETPFYRRLRRWIDLAMKRRWAVIGGTAAAFAIAVFGMKFVPQQFFPNSSRPELIVELRMREGASFAATAEQVERMEAILAKDADVKSFTAYTGAGAPRFYLALSPELPNPGYAALVVMTSDPEARERVRARLMASAGEQFPQAWVRVTRLELGPPVGFPVQFRVVGPDTQIVRSIARDVERVMNASPLLRDVQLDWNDPVRVLRMDVDQDKARALGLTPADVALATQTLTNGLIAVAASRRRGAHRHRRASRALGAARPRRVERRERVHAQRDRGAALSNRQGSIRARGARALAPESGHGDHRARRRQGRGAGRIGDAIPATGGNGHRSQVTGWVSNRCGRRSRGEQQGESGACSCRAGDDVYDPADTDAAAAELLADVHRGHDCTTRAHRSRRGASVVPCAARLRRNPRNHRLERNDHAQFGDPDRSGANGAGRRSRSLGRGGGGGGAQGSPRRVDRDCHCARDDSVDAQRVLGADGHSRHGRADHRHAAHDLLRAGAVRGLVPDRAPNRPRGELGGTVIWYSRLDAAGTEGST